MIGWSLAGAVLALLIMGLAPPIIIVSALARSRQRSSSLLSILFNTDSTSLIIPSEPCPADPFHRGDAVLHVLQHVRLPTSTLTESAQTRPHHVNGHSRAFLSAHRRQLCPSVYGQSFPWSAPDLQVRSAW
ncbi:MAG: hypothetical protein IPO36_00030 [Anaerolineales bacterium]|nr:hypothetical protein [Anaerolineales bacterium]